MPGCHFHFTFESNRYVIEKDFFIVIVIITFFGEVPVFEKLSDCF